MRRRLLVKGGYERPNGYLGLNKFLELWAAEIGMDPQFAKYLFKSFVKFVLRCLGSGRDIYLTGFLNILLTPLKGKSWKMNLPIFLGEPVERQSKDKWKISVKLVNSFKKKVNMILGPPSKEDIRRYNAKKKIIRGNRNDTDESI